MRDQVLTGTKLIDFVKTGDIIFKRSDAWISRMIRKVTDGKVNHVMMVIGDKVFETDAKYRGTAYNDLPEVAREGLVIIRPVFLMDKHRERLFDIAEKYHGIPYDYFDIGLNLIFSPLATDLRKRLITFFGTKNLLKCDELVLNLLYDVSLRKEFRWTEGHTPASLLSLCLHLPRDFRVLYWGLPQG